MHNLSLTTEESRLKGSIMRPDYDFLDSRLDKLFAFLYFIFKDSMMNSKGLLARLRWHRFELAVLERFYPTLRGISEYKDNLRKTISSFNNLFLFIVENSIGLLQQKLPSLKKYSLIKTYYKNKLRKIELNYLKEMAHFYELNLLYSEKK